MSFCTQDRGACRQDREQMDKCQSTAKQLFVVLRYSIGRPKEFTSDTVIKLSICQCSNGRTELGSTVCLPLKVKIQKP